MSRVLDSAELSKVRLSSHDFMSTMTKLLEDIVAVAAGFVDGLGWGSNSKGVLTPFRVRSSRY